MMISRMKAIPPMMKDSHTVSLNFWSTGTVYSQLSPKLPVNISPIHAKKPEMIPPFI